MEIEYFNRVTGKKEIEKVYGEGAVNWMYGSVSGKIMSPFLVNPLFSKMYGSLQNTSWSAGKVKPFIKDFNINMEEYLPEENRTVEDPYSSFNKFFIRRFKDGARTFVQGDAMASFSEARFFGYESVTAEEKIPVKGKYLNPKDLIGNSEWEKTFEDGPLLLARLCPVDYHRYHYPDNGKIVANWRVHGELHSVNPVALKKRPDIFLKNERHVTILETEQFGKLAYIEVGAICVGKIVQSHKGETFSRGDEKGYFLFGGSTVIVVGEKGKWKPSDDILNNTKNGIETYLHLGMSVANKL